MESWRDSAIQHALQAEAQSGEGIDALLEQIRRCRPGCATLLLWPDRLQMMRFLAEKAGDMRSLITGSDGHIERNQVCPYVGWYAVVWQGIPIEVALTPSSYICGCVLCIADDLSGLHRFSRALEDYALRPAGRSLRYSNYWKSAPELDAEIGKVTWEDLVLAPRLLDEVREAIEGFYRHRDAFTALDFPWKRGLLLIGPPGTGKTMICKAAAAALPDLPFLYVRDFAVGKEDEYEDDHGDAIRAIFNRARRLSPCLLAFEDIDGLVNDTNRTVFLNELDGFHNNNGLLIIASSNHPERIDEALLKRPSRFDRVFHIGLPAREERRTYCLRLLSRATIQQRLAPDFDVEALAKRVAERSEGFTPAYLKEVFVTATLRQAQAGVMVLDERFAEAALAHVEELRKHLRRMKNPESLSEYTGAEQPLIGIRARNRS